VNYALGEALRERKPADAVGFYRAALATRPAVAKVHAEVAMALFRQGQYDEAILAHRRSIELEPDAASHNNLGICLRARGRLDEAMAEFRRAIELEPGNARAHSNLGICLRARGPLDEAMAAHRRT